MADRKEIDAIYEGTASVPVLSWIGRGPRGHGVKASFEGDEGGPQYLVLEDDATGKVIAKSANIVPPRIEVEQLSDGFALKTVSAAGEVLDVKEFRAEFMRGTKVHMADLGLTAEPTGAMTVPDPDSKYRDGDVVWFEFPNPDGAGTVYGQALLYSKLQTGDWLAAYTGRQLCTTAGPPGADGEDGADGADGEDAVLLRVDSSRGSLFKHNEVGTVLSATVFVGGQRIDALADLKARFGSGVRIEWEWQAKGKDDWGTIVSTDPRLSNGGFSLAVTPDDVDGKIVFRCNLIV